MVAENTSEPRRAIFHVRKSVRAFGRGFPRNGMARNRLGLVARADDCAAPDGLMARSKELLLHPHRSLQLPRSRCQSMLPTWCRPAPFTLGAWVRYLTIAAYAPVTTGGIPLGKVRPSLIDGIIDQAVQRDLNFRQFVAKSAICRRPHPRRFGWEGFESGCALTAQFPIKIFWARRCIRSILFSRCEAYASR